MLGVLDFPTYLSASADAISSGSQTTLRRTLHVVGLLLGCLGRGVGLGEFGLGFWGWASWGDSYGVPLVGGSVVFPGLDFGVRVPLVDHGLPLSMFLVAPAYAY